MVRESYFFNSFVCIVFYMLCGLNWTTKYYFLCFIEYRTMLHFLTQIKFLKRKQEMPTLIGWIVGSSRTISKDEIR